MFDVIACHVVRMVFVLIQVGVVEHFPFQLTFLDVKFEVRVAFLFLLL